MTKIHITQNELAHRWAISPRTLERWRWIGGGPRFIKVGGRVLYSLAEIEAYELRQTRSSTADSPQAHAAA